MAYFRSPFRFFVFLLIIAAVLFILYGVGLLNPVVSGAKVITNPVKGGFTWVGDTFSGWLSFVGDISNMDEENENLRQEVDGLKSENTKLKEIVHENEQLRQEIGFQHEHAYDTIPAAVIGRSLNPGLKIIEINIGSSRGIEENMPVIVSQGLLAGIVTEVFETSSTVLLLPDKQSNVNAVVQDSRASGIVKGQHGLDLRMELIPQNEEINTGQTIVTSGLAGVFPAGLLIGVAHDIEETPNSLFKEARIEPAVDFDHLEIVFVITGAR